jgi:predicted secreted protein
MSFKSYPGPGKILRAILIVFAIFSCTQGKIMQTLTEKDNNSTIQLAVEEILKVELNEASVTGYLWEIDKNMLKSEIEIEEDNIPPDTDAEGAKGVKVFRIKAIKKGEGIITFKYWQKWEEDVENTFVVNLTIN